MGRGPCGVIEDIFSSEYDGGGRSKKNGRALYRKRSEREQGREMAYKKFQVLTKISRNQAL
jgi:hypothetical protein